MSFSLLVYVKRNPVVAESNVTSSASVGAAENPFHTLKLLKSSEITSPSAIKVNLTSQFSGVVTGESVVTQSVST